MAGSGGEPMLDATRRAFITLLGGAAFARPRAAWTQQAPRMLRVGVRMTYVEDTPLSQDRLASFLEEMKKLGWTAGRNVQIDYRWGIADADRNRRNAAELVALAPDVIVASATAVTAALLQTTRTI